MSKTEELECTCGYFCEPWIHHVDCLLWDDVDFTMGTMLWDPNEWELSEAPYDGPGRTEDDWILILDTETADIDAWRASGILETEFGPDDDAALAAWLEEKAKDDKIVIQENPGAVTNVEYASAEGPSPDVLRCFCVNEAKGTYCGPCGLTRTSDKEEWKLGWFRRKWLEDPDRKTKCECQPMCTTHCEKSGLQRWSSKATYWTYWDSKAKSSSYGTTFMKCRHYGVPVTFPDGTTVYASSLKNQKKEGDDLIPDLGIYMDGSWKPTSVAYHLGWFDFSTPSIPDDHVRFIVDQGIEWARDGQIVEVGCVGGHGRTGSLLALMALSCGVPDPVEAVKWVRKNYCPEAIEGTKQEWYVKKYHAILNDLPIPPEPVTVKTVTNTSMGSTTTSTSHTSVFGSKGDGQKVAVAAPPSVIGSPDYGWEDLMGWL